MSETNELKVFTAEEANLLLPKLTGLLHEIRAKQQELSAKEVEIDAMELLSSSEMAHETENYNEWVNHFYSLIDKIHEMGCFLKDVETGLVDFYTLYEGRVVYLCWKLGEEKIGFWHEVGRGYAYRQPLLQEGEKESSG